MAKSAIKYPNSKQYKKTIEKGDLEHLYLFIGEENAEKDKYIDLITKKLFKGKQKDEINVRRFHAESDDINLAGEYVLNESMFSPQKICILLNIDTINSKDKEKQLALNTIIENLPDSAILILTSKNNRVPACIAKKNLEKIQVVHFWRLFESEIEKYIINELRNFNKNIDHKATLRMIQLLGRDLNKIDHAISQIVNRSEDKIITEQLVLELVADEKQVIIFELINNIFNKNKRSLYLLKKIIGEGIHELVVLVFIKREAEKLEKYYAMKNHDMSDSEIFKNLKIPTADMQNFIERANLFTPVSVKNIFTSIYKTEYEIKNYNLSKAYIANPLVELITNVIK